MTPPVPLPPPPPAVHAPVPVQHVQSARSLGSGPVSRIIDVRNMLGHIGSAYGRAPENRGRPYYTGKPRGAKHASKSKRSHGIKASKRAKHRRRHA